MAVDGKYDVTIKTPMGDQNAVLTVTASGDTFAGDMSGSLGSMEITDGTVSGDTLGWTMDLKVPMPMKLDCSATVTADAISGSVKAGAFGEMALSGTRVA